MHINALFKKEKIFCEWFAIKISDNKGGGYASEKEPGYDVHTFFQVRVTSCCMLLSIRY
jgi:hypothetical protein